MNKFTKEIFQYVLALIVVLGFFLATYYLLNKIVPAENKDLINIAFGALIASFTQVFNWFFGSSKGSSEKTQMMNENKSKKEEKKPEPEKTA